MEKAHFCNNARDLCHFPLKANQFKGTVHPKITLPVKRVLMFLKEVSYAHRGYFKNVIYSCDDEAEISTVTTSVFSVT